MMKLIQLVLLSFLGATLAAAGTLDNAPFRVALPDTTWKLNDSTAQDMGKNVFLVAAISSTNSSAKSMIIKAELENPGPSALNELCAGIKDQFANPAVKKISEEQIAFLGFKAKRFTYLVNENIYNEAVVFVAGKNGWTIVSTGPARQSIEIKKLFSFYQSK
jgi:hypothetical protein